jgi:hypothetical protein
MIPDGSAIITPNQMYAELLDVGKKVDRLASALDPWQAEIRNEIASNRERIEQIRAERIEQFAALEIRVRQQETAGYVTGGRMWVAVASIAAVVTAIAAVVVLIIR